MTEKWPIVIVLSVVAIIIIWNYTKDVKNSMLNLPPYRALSMKNLSMSTISEDSVPKVGDNCTRPHMWLSMERFFSGRVWFFTCHWTFKVMEAETPWVLERNDEVCLMTLPEMAPGAFWQLTVNDTFTCPDFCIENRDDGVMFIFNSVREEANAYLTMLICQKNSNITFYGRRKKKLDSSWEVLTNLFTRVWRGERYMSTSITYFDTKI